MSLPLLPAYITNHPAFTSLQHLLSPVTHRLNDLLFSDPPPTMSQLPSETFDPATPSVPISYPVKTLEDLESRAYFNSFHFRFNKASVPLSPHASSPLPDRRRLLVCHDMAGGYGDDKWVQGGTNPEAFDLTHWNLMDVFVYFSHSLVTLPPPSWTNTAHLHGVKVLGTFITEWEEGKIIANEMLSTKESAQMYAERLTELALALGFDGWLLNMEVSLDVSVIPNLKEFVSHLSTTMHSSVPGSLVIWYDSITIDGELRWQDQLNEKNKPFFDLCDGIFVNYTWKESYPGLSGAVAGHRRHDVYMGIDVFGRNTFGGGQWNSNIALDLLRKEDVSAALFAPGWVYETKQPPDYQTAKTHWWSLVEKSWGVAQSYPKSLPFYSNFDQGHGFHFSVDGKQVLDTPWNNISCQGLQPFIGFSPQNAVQVTIDFKEACYSGGSNILFNGRLEGHNDFKASLFHGDILLGDFPLQLTFSVKSEADSQLGLYLKYYSMEGESNSILLAPHKENNISARFDQVIETTQTSTQSGWVIHRSSIAVKGKKLTEIGAVCFTATSGGNYRAALGHISIKNSEEPGPSFPPSSSWLVEAKNVKWTATKGSESLVDVQIDWKMRDGNDSLFPRYNVYAENAPDLLGQETVRKFLGVASVESFYVDGFSVPSDISGVKFVIQVCGSDGSNQKIEESPFLRLDKPKE